MYYPEEYNRTINTNQIVNDKNKTATKRNIFKCFLWARFKARTIGPLKTNIITVRLHHPFSYKNHIF